MKNFYKALGCLFLSFSSVFGQPIGSNLGEPQDWSVDWPIADAGHVSRSAVGDTGVVFWDRGPEMPDGVYIFEVHASSSGSVSFSAGSTNFTVQPGNSFSINITDANAGNGVFINSGFSEDFSIWLPDSYGQVASEAWLKSVKPFSVIRWMDKQRTNGSNITEIADLPSMNGSWANGYPLQVIHDLSVASGTVPWICIPHKASDELVAYIAAFFSDIPGTRYEYSNEVWNGGFSQHAWVGNAYGAGFGTEWERAWAGYGRRSTQVMKIVRANDPDGIRVFASQNGNVYVSQQILIAALEEGGGELFADEWSVAPYFGNTITENSSFWSGQPYSAWVAEAHRHIDVVMNNAQKHANLVAPFGIVLTIYEGGNHVAPLGNDVNDSSWVNRTIEFGHLPEQEEIHSHYIKAWKNVTNSGLFMYYMLAYSPTKFGSWGLTDQLDGSSPRRKGIFVGLVDLNDDGIVDNGDINIFVNRFLASDLSADLNGDGILDNGDIGIFVVYFLEATI